MMAQRGLALGVAPPIPVECLVEAEWGWPPPLFGHEPALQ